MAMVSAEQVTCMAVVSAEQGSCRPGCRLLCVCVFLPLYLGSCLLDCSVRLQKRSIAGGEHPPTLWKCLRTLAKAL